MNIPSSLKKIAKVAQSPIYAVGGSVRNFFTKFGKTDIDICGPELTNRLLLPSGARLKVVSENLGTAIILYGGDEYEYTPFRTETYHHTGVHTPSSVQFVSDLQIDSQRRDFACNAIYYDLKNAKFIDPCNGIKDCKDRVLRQVNDKVFCVDGLRILRLIRFASELGFRIEHKTKQNAYENLHLLENISSERKRIEWDKILYADIKYNVKDGFINGVSLAHKLGILSKVSPDLEHNVLGVEQALQQLAYAKVHVRLSLFLYNNPNAESVLYSLKYSNDTIKHTLNTIHACKQFERINFNHMQLRLFVIKNFLYIDSIIDLLYALAQGMNNEKNSSLIQVYRTVTLDKTPKTLRELEIDGYDLLSLNIDKKNFSKILHSVWEHCILYPNCNDKKWLLDNISKFL
ncbi:MAG: hypothetical protein LBU60_01380 [Clostridiales bacterium]|jgi:tRNA nucleotidyltransferase/poly(A) polymerase|nr:hypothetical protein [Clostridiales bacterium]